VTDGDHLWDACAALLREQVSEPVWHTAFEGARPVQLYDGTLTLSVPSPMAKERIEGRYLGLVRDAMTEVGAGHLDLVLEVEPSDPGPLWTVSQPSAPPGAASPLSSTSHNGEARRDGEIIFPGSDVPRYTFEAFVIGASNRFAHAAALAVAEMPARKYNPLFIYGEAGLGKTHLLQAIAHYVNENYPTYRVRYVSSETFLNEFIDSMQRRTRDEFKRRYRDIDVLLVDDVQFFAGKEETVEEFFHTFNHLHQANRQIVLSSDRPPDQIGIEDRLRSRFQQGLMTDIQPPELETRLAILRKKAERETTFIPNEILEFIGTHITDNIRVLEGALIRVSAFSNLTAEELTVDRAAEILADLLSDRQPRPITPQVILDATSEMFNFPVEEIIGKNRRRPLVTARQISMYVFRELTDLSYPAIAREFGGRDHTTVMHAVDKIGSLMSKQRQIYDQVTELTTTIRNG
jgi:chromosomal replication initiator protein